MHPLEIIVKLAGTLRVFLQFLRRKKTYLIIIFAVIITLAASSIISIWLSSQASIKIPSMGRITALGVEAYWDQNLKNKTETITWQTIEIGTTKNITIYFHSTSNTPTTLQLNITGWNPTELSKYMNLTWDYDGTTIMPSQTILVTLTLSASDSRQFLDYLTQNQVQRFQFDMAVYAKEKTG